MSAPSTPWFPMTHDDATNMGTAISNVATAITNLGFKIDDTAGAGDTDQTWSADKLVTEFAGKYEKPEGGIPGTDLASGVIPDISGKADITLLAPDYGELTFPVTAGTRCTHGGGYYKANQDINNSEDWTAAHWTAIMASEDVSDLLTAINGKVDEPSSEGTSGQVLTTDGNGGRSWTSKPSVPVTDVTVAGSSVLSNGTAAISYGTTDNPGVFKIANDAQVKAGGYQYGAIVPLNQHRAAFYGLAKVAGNTDQATSSNSVGTYTEDAKSKISEMLNAPVSVSGSTPSITAKSGVRYVCGEVATLSVTLPASGDVEIMFTSGSTPTVLTLTPPTGVTSVKFPAWFNPSSLDASCTYDMIITNGEFGVVTAWA